VPARAGLDEQGVSCCQGPGRADSHPGSGRDTRLVAIPKGGIQGRCEGPSAWLIRSPRPTHDSDGGTGSGSKGRHLRPLERVSRGLVASPRCILAISTSMAARICWWMGEPTSATPTSIPRSSSNDSLRSIRGSTADHLLISGDVGETLPPGERRISLYE